MVYVTCDYVSISWLQQTVNQHQDSTGTMFSGRTCSDSSVLRRGEEVTLWDGDGSQAQDAHHYQVDKAGLWRAVEGVVQPGHEGAHDEEGDPTVVQPGHANTKRLKTAARKGSEARLRWAVQVCRRGVLGLTWRRLWRRPRSGSTPCGRARRRRGRGWLPGKTSRSPLSPGPEPRRTCWAGTCTSDPGRGKTGSLQRATAHEHTRLSAVLTFFNHQMSAESQIKERWGERRLSLYLAGGSRCFPSRCGSWRCSWSRRGKKAWAAYGRGAGSRCPSANQGARREVWRATGPPTSDWFTG